MNTEEIGNSAEIKNLEVLHLVDYYDKDVVIVDNFRDFNKLRSDNSEPRKVGLNILLVALKGHMQFSLAKGRQVTVQAGQVLVMHSDTWVDDVMATPDFDCKIIGLTDRIMQRFLGVNITTWDRIIYSHNVLVGGVEHANAESGYKLYDLMKLLMQEKNNPYYTQIMQSLMQCTIYIMLAQLKKGEEEHGQMLIDEQGEPTAQGESLHQGKLMVARFIKLLATEPSKRHSVGYYAAKLCVSPKYLSTAAKRYTGKTALQWIQQYSLEEIHAALDDPSVCIKEVAEKCGFPNLSFFGRYVKNHFGCSPTAYRRQLLSQKQAQ